MTDKTRNKLAFVWWAIGWIGIGFIVAFTLSGCKTKYVTVPEYHNVYVDKHDTLLLRDSIFEKDSVWMMIKGDTITTFRTKILYRDRWRDKIVYRDSLRVDSIRVPYPVERKLNKWEKFKMEVGGIGAGCMLLVVVGAALWLIRWIRRKRNIH